jgi:hypothetical protein
MEDDGSLGTGFWLKLCGTIIGLGIAGLIFFILITDVWYAWGFMAALIFVGAVLGTGIYIADRRKQREYEELA